MFPNHNMHRQDPPPQVWQHIEQRLNTYYNNRLRHSILWAHLLSLLLCLLPVGWWYKHEHPTQGYIYNIYNLPKWEQAQHEATSHHNKNSKPQISAASLQAYTSISLQGSHINQSQTTLHLPAMALLASSILNTKPILLSEYLQSGIAYPYYKQPEIAVPHSHMQPSSKQVNTYIRLSSTALFIEPKAQQEPIRVYTHQNTRMQLDQLPMAHQLQSQPSIWYHQLALGLPVNNLLSFETGIAMLSYYSQQHWKQWKPMRIPSGNIQPSTAELEISRRDTPTNDLAIHEEDMQWNQALYYLQVPFLLRLSATNYRWQLGLNAGLQLSRRLHYTSSQSVHQLPFNPQHAYRQWFIDSQASISLAYQLSTKWQASLHTLVCHPLQSLGSTDNMQENWQFAMGGGAALQYRF